MVEDAVRAAVRKYLQAVRAQGITVRQGIIFGSQVKGTTHMWSDIDLLVISPLFDAPRCRQHTDLLWRLS
jgi:predicted nucleotidyltransferase